MKKLFVLNNYWYKFIVELIHVLCYRLVPCYVQFAFDEPSTVIRGTHIELNALMAIMMHNIGYTVNCSPLTQFIRHSSEFLIVQCRSKPSTIYICMFASSCSTLLPQTLFVIIIIIVICLCISEPFFLNYSFSFYPCCPL